MLALIFLSYKIVLLAEMLNVYVRKYYVELKCIILSLFS